ncbi:MAG: methenyltetrahydrofolate cyclohydrolase [Gaiellaceae bacterium]|jgi:formiminotetrahydrofolate cyclodeaminase|nr:methenyltetrahydrofolate cyclohydrolase [Gaiellaceae bacterium]
MWDDPGPVDVPRIDALLDALASDQPAPGGGSAAALVGAMAAALCAKVALLSEDGGSTAQAAALCRKLTALAEEDARLFKTALSELELRDDDFKLGRALEQAADAPLRIAEACADVAALASALAGHGAPALQADARSAAALAAGAARASAVLVEVNLGASGTDERVQLAQRLSEQADAAARL